MVEEAEHKILQGIIKAQAERIRQLELGMFPGITMGAAMIATERMRQIESEGYSAAHDEPLRGKLALAAACYARNAVAQIGGTWHYEQPYDWPLEHSMWKPKVDVVLTLVRAGALIAAEIDRILKRREEENARPNVARDDLEGKPAAGSPGGAGTEARPAPAGDAKQ